MAAALWDVLAKVANLAQLSGVHAITLLTVALRLLQIPECMWERAELERCARRLRALLRPGPAIAGGCEIIPLHPVMEGLALMALRDADSLVSSYDGSTFWRRLRTGRTMAGQFRDVHNRIDSCCFLVLFAHSYVFTQESTGEMLDHQQRQLQKLVLLLPLIRGPTILIGKGLAIRQTIPTQDAKPFRNRDYYADFE